MTVTTIAVQPFVMKDCTLTINSDGYEAHVSTVQWDPTSGVVVWKGLTPTSVHNFGSTATWLCKLEYAQDWTTEDSLSAYLHAHEGEAIPATFVPLDGGPTVTATIVIAPGSIGGKVDDVATASVSLGSTKPVITPAA